MWVKELERYDEKLWCEKVEFIKDCEKFYLECVKYFDIVCLVMKGKIKRKESSDDKEKLEVKLFVEDIEEDNNEEIFMELKLIFGEF